MFGIEVDSNDGKRLIMSEAAHLNFVGKAGDATGFVYLSDFNTTVDTSGGGTLTLTYPDEVRWFDLFIDAEEEPLCFVYDARQSANYATGITHIYKVSSGTYGIGLQQTYPSNSRPSTTKVDIYCFTRPRGFSAGYGLELSDRNGTPMFHSDMEFLSVKGFAEVPHWNDYSGLIYNHNIANLTKPAMPCFSNIAATYITTKKSTSGGGCTTRYVMNCVNGVCTGSTVYSCNYQWSQVKLRQMYRHTMGVNSVGIHQHLIGYPADISDVGTDGVAYPAFDGVVMPVIEGADYD